ncbi:transcription factor bHLH52-like [Ipomoea triloba]|uniref:transcription factor bHLH52-like n=1 Tax=Ipomoea triloba TaxID=35885 RepID=UPI00125E2DA5|nr:transcription factor bHLH52-like [Ipomoea triloba]
MASLSYCSNWGTAHHDHHLNFCETLEGSGAMAPPPFFAQPPQMVDNNDQLEAPAAELLFGLNNHTFVLPEPAVSPFDPVFNSGEFIFSDNYVSLPPPEYSIPQEVEFRTHPKRQKLYHNRFPEITENCFGVFIPNPPLLHDLNPPPPPLESVLPTFPELATAPFPAYCAESEVAVKKNDNGAKTTLSAQSIAARERRRRITEKTQELGKLIPGGQKMNTAEMFQAAYKYIKFMQTQLSVLQSCHHSSQETGETFMNQELETLVGSSLIQEKLYSNDKCLVPEKFVHSLPNGHELCQLYQPNKSS